MNQKSFEESYQEAFHYFFTRENQGLEKTIKRYESQKSLQSLPPPRPSD